jgi:DNA modification methylase
MAEKYHEKPVNGYTPMQRDFIEKDKIVECLYSGQGETCVVTCRLWNKCWGSLENKLENIKVQ